MLILGIVDPGDQTMSLGLLLPPQKCLLRLLYKTRVANWAERFEKWERVGMQCSCLFLSTSRSFNVSKLFQIVLSGYHITGYLIP